jgi:fibronectin-binding autotransporter adhesin
LNHIYRLVWNAASGEWQVASELATSRRRGPTRRVARRARQISSTTLAAIAIACASPTFASGPVFDGNGAAAPDPAGSGTWNTTDAHWFDGGMFRAWDNGALHRAVFEAPGTITIGAPVVAGGLRFGAAGVTLSGGHLLTLGGAREIVLDDGASATITAPFTGGFRLSGHGNAFLQVNGNNAGVYDGVTTLGRDARLVLGHVHALGSETDASRIVLEDGARLDFATNGAFSFDYTLAGGTARLTPRASSGTFSGAPTLLAPTTLVFGSGNNGAQTWSGRLADTGAHALSFLLEATEGYGATLSGTNTYSGATFLRAGQLTLSHAAALSPNTHIDFQGAADYPATLAFAWPGTVARTLGTGAGQVHWSGSGGFRGMSGTTTVTLNGNATLAWGAGGFVPDGSSLLVGNNVVFTNAIDLGDAQRSVFGGGTIAGVLGGDGGLRVRGGLLTLSAANTWRGATVIDARSGDLFNAQLMLGHARALPGGIGVEGGESNLVFDNGLLMLGAASGDFLRGLGTAGHQVRFTGSGGFGSASGLRTVDLGGAGATLAWGAGGFVPDGASLGFASRVAGASILFRNGLDLAGGERTIVLGAPPVAASVPHRAVRLDGTIGNGALVLSGFGEVVLGAANTYTGRTVIGNTEVSTRVVVDRLADGGVASNLGASTREAGNLWFGSAGTGNFASLVYTGTGASTDRDFTLAGHGELASDGSGALAWHGTPTVLAGSHVFRLGGANTATNLFAGTLHDGAGKLSFVKHGAGTWRLGGTNTFTGGVSIGGAGFGLADPGVLEVETLGNAGVAGSLGINAGNAASQLTMFGRGVLRYVGTGETTDRNLLRGLQSGGPADRTFGIALESSGTGALTWTGRPTMQGTGNAWFRLGGTNEDFNRFAGTLSNAGQAISLAKEGTGVWGLAGANTHTGATQILDGVLRLEHANALAGGLGANDAAGSALHLSGGILGLTAASGDLTRALGDTAGRNRIAWTASGGFAAYDATRVVDLGGAGATLTWGSTHFIGDGDRLRLGHRTADATLDFRNGIDFADGERIVDVADGKHAVDGMLSGVLSGAGGMVKQGEGTLRVTGDNTYAGRTRVEGGVVEVARIGNTGGHGNLGLGVGGADALHIDGGVLRHVGADDASDRGFTIGVNGATLEADGTGALVLDGDIVAGGARTLTLGGTSAFENRLGGPLGEAGDVALVKSGEGTWALGADSLLASVDIRAGTLQLGTGGTEGAVGTVAISNAGTLAFARSDTATFASVVSGTGAIVQRGTGASVLTGIGSTAGRVAIERGTLQIDGMLESAQANLGEGTLRIGSGVLQAQGGAATSVSGIAGTAGTLAIDAGGTLRAIGDLGDGADVLVLAGALDTQGGVLALGEGDDTLHVQATGTVGGRIDGGAAGDDTVLLDDTIDFAFDDAALSGFERLRKQNANVATLVGDGIYAGGVEIDGGRLAIGAGVALETPEIVVADDATLAVAGIAHGLGGSHAHITGEAGTSTVRVDAGGTLVATGDLGGGHDVLDVAGVLDIGGGVFALGDGDDAFVVHDGTHVIGAVDGGAGEDTRVYAIAGSATLGSLLNFEALSKRGAGTLHVDGALPTSLADVEVLGGTLRIGAGATVTDVIATRVDAGTTLDVAGTFRGSLGDDTMTVAGTVTGSGTVDLSEGDDTLVIRDGASFDNAVEGGDATTADTVAIDNAFALAFDGSVASGFEALHKRNVGTATLAGPGASTYVADVHIAEGTLVVGAAHVLQAPTIAIGAGATLRVEGQARNGSGATQVDGDAGANHVRVDAGGTLHATGDLGAGNDRLDIAGVLDVDGGVFALGDGDDTFVVHDGTSVLGTVDGGAGQDTRAYDIEGIATVGALLNFEGLAKLGTGTLRLDGPAASPLSDVHVVGGTLHVGSAGEVSDVVTSRIETGARLLLDGRVTGSVGHDAMTIAGTIEGAGTVDLDDGDDTLVLHDGADLSQLANALSGGAGEDKLEVDIDGVATLAGMTDFEHLDKRGAGTLRVLGAAPSDFTRVAATGGTLDVGSAGRIAGVVDTTVGEGATLHVDGAYIGSSGDDVFTLAGTVSGSGTMSLFDGDDTLVVRDGARLLNTVDGGMQRVADTLVLESAHALTFDAVSATGFEALRKRGAGIATMTGSGAFAAGAHIEAGVLAIAAGQTLETSTIVVADGAALRVAGSVTAQSGARAEVTGDAGTNIVQVDAGGTLFARGDLGDGDDILDVAGVLDAGNGVFALGDGDDVFVVHDGTHVIGTVDGGAGQDTRAYDIAGSARIGALVNFEALAKLGAGTLHIDGPVATPLAEVDVAGGTLQVASAARIVDVVATTVGHGAALHVDGEYRGSPGADTMTLHGTIAGTGTIDLADGDDALVLRDDAVLANVVDGGAQAMADTLVLDTTLAFAFDGANVVGFEALRKRNAGIATLAGTGTSRYDAGVRIDAGTLAIAAEHGLETATVDIAGDATLHVDGVVSAIGGGTTTLTGDAGANHVRIGGDGALHATGDLGAGDDVLDLAGILDTGDGAFLLGDGDDTLVVHDTTQVRGTLDAGLGNDQLTVDVRDDALVRMDNATGFESLGKAGNGALQFDGRADFFDVDVMAGLLNVANGAAIEARNTRIDAGAMLRIDGHFGGTMGDDTLSIAGAVAGVGGIDLGDGDDTLTLQDGADLSGLATAVDGGAGRDALRVDFTGVATLGGAVGFESLRKTNSGVLRIAGPAGSVFEAMDIVEGVVDIGAAGQVEGLRTLVVEAGATLANAGRVAFTADVDTVRIDGTLAGPGLFDLGAGDDVLHGSGRFSGALALGDGEDATTFAGATFDGLSIDGGAGYDRLAFVASALDATSLPAFVGFERVRLLQDSRLALANAFDLHGGVLDIDATSALHATAGARVLGDLESAGGLHVGDARLGIAGRYLAHEGALLHVTVAPLSGVAGGLDIDGDVVGHTGIVFASDGTQGFEPASIVVVRAPEDVGDDGGFFAVDAFDGVVRLSGSPFAWTFGHDAAERAWTLRTDERAPLVPEFPGYSAVSTIAIAAVQDTHRVVLDRLAAVRGEAPRCGNPANTRGRDLRVDECRGAWMAVFGSALDVGANPGAAFDGETHGLLAGSDRVFPSDAGSVFRAGWYGGVLRGRHATSGINSTPHPGAGIAQVRTTTPVLGFYSGTAWPAGGYLDADLVAHRPKSDVHAQGGFLDAVLGNSLSLQVQGGRRLQAGAWRLEPQVALGVSAQHWRDRFDVGGRDLVFADSVIGTARAALRIERPFTAAGGVVRPWAAVAVSGTFGEPVEALRIRAVGGESLGLPGHALGTVATLDLGVEAELGGGWRWFGTASAGEAVSGTDAAQRQASVGFRRAW